MKDIIEGIMLFLFGWDWSDPIDVFFALSLYVTGSLILVTKILDFAKWLAKSNKPRR